MDLKILPEPVQRACLELPKNRACGVQELRFRKGRPVMAGYPWGEQILAHNGSPILVTDKLLEEILARATGFSPYALRLEETGLYLPLKDGCRLGLCGETVIKDGKLSGIRQIYSLALRIAREQIGIAQETGDKLVSGNRVDSALILSPPGGGKTTFLRDLIRCISEKGIRVSVVDERRELGAEGKLDLGPTTDVLWAAPKVQAIPLLIRAMNPQVLALDEISGERELEEALYASFSGVSLLATAHGTGVGSLYARPLYRRLVESGAFVWLITLEAQGKPKMERLILNDKVDGCHLRHPGICDGGLGCRPWIGGTPEDSAATQAQPGADAGGTGIKHAPLGTAI